MLKIVRFLLALIICLPVCVSLVAQPRVQPDMLPGQVPRTSLSGGLIYQCNFDKSIDIDNKGWPGGWTRKESLDNDPPFPRHLVLGITESPNPLSNYVFRMNMEGGAAAAFSPKIPIRAGMSYTVSAYVETNTLVHDEVSILALFYSDDVIKPIRTVESKKIRNTSGWQQLTIGPVAADMPKVKFLSVGLLVAPTNRQDFGAKVNFTAVQIRESPSISLDMGNDNHLFFITRQLSVQCLFRGVDPRQHSVLFILEDPFGRVIGQREIEMMVGIRPAEFIVTPQNAQEVIPGTATWSNLPVPSPGFYRIRVATPEAYIDTLRLPPDQTFDDPLHATEPLTFVVMSPNSFCPGGEFGWTLDGWTLDDMKKALPMLSQSGLSHLKLPVWLSPESSPEQQKDLRQFCNNLSEQQVRLTGLLNPVPESVLSEIPVYGQVNAASILGTDPRLWGDSLQPTLRALSLHVKDWQWTSDTDQSLIDLFFDANGNITPAGTERFRAFQKLFDQDQFSFGIGLTWNWYQDVPNGEFPFPNCFLNFPIDSSIAAEDAASFLAEMPATALRRSVSIAPLPADDYPLHTRIQNFVQSLIFLKAAGMDNICLTAPRDEQIGVLRRDGTPNELYLPWRTTATLLSGSRLLGSITLPNRSRNYCFDKGGGVCLMVVWNDEATADNPVQESLYLGDGLEMIDIWGKSSVPEQIGNNQMILVTQTPLFITGLNIDVARFRLNMQTNIKVIAAVPNKTYSIPFSYKNEAAVPVSIQISPQGPRLGDWTIKPLTQTANLESGIAGTGIFDLTLTSRADTGRRLFQYDVKTTGTKSPEFAVYDELMIGNPDIFMEFVSRLNDDGDIELLQVFTNNTESIQTYDCRLTVPNRAVQKYQIRRQGFGQAEHVYTIPRGKALLDAGVTEMRFSASPVRDGTGSNPLGQPMIYTIPLISE